MDHVEFTWAGAVFAPWAQFCSACIVLNDARVSVAVSDKDVPIPRKGNVGSAEERPDMEAKEMLKQLQATGYGSFSDGQLRTLQRRVLGWRTSISRELVYGLNPAAAATEAGERPALVR